MNAIIRLDDKGCPYLIVNYQDREGDEQTAGDDAERLFFTHLNQNGGLLHLVPGKGKQMRMLVTTGTVKRKASVTESGILGRPESRYETRDESDDSFSLLKSARSGESNKSDKKLNDLVEKVEKELGNSEFPEAAGREDIPGDTCE